MYIFSAQTREPNHLNTELKHLCRNACLAGPGDSPHLNIFLRSVLTRVKKSLCFLGSGVNSSDGLIRIIQNSDPFCFVLLRCMRCICFSSNENHHIYTDYTCVSDVRFGCAFHCQMRFLC
jgi:hypothetical protein